MSCVHLKKLFQLCEENQIEFSSGDMVHIVCNQCQQQEVCPTRPVETEADEEGSVGQGTPATPTRRSRT